MAYQVTAPLVIAKSETGADLYIYENGLVPAGQSGEWIEQHLESEMIAEIAGPTTDVAGKKPSARASVEKWHEYAIAQGMDEAEVAELDKEQIQALFDTE